MRATSLDQKPMDNHGRLLRSRSGIISSLPRRSNAGAASQDPFSPNSPSAPRRVPAGASLARSKSTAKDRLSFSPDTSADSSSSPSAGALRRSSKENRTTLSPRFPPPPDPAATPRKQRLTSPSAWALSPGRSLPRSVTAPPDVGGKKVKSGLVSSWTRSTARSPSFQMTDAPGTAASAPTAKKGGGSVGGVLGLFRRRKEAPEREEESHQHRMLTSRLAQWRFANARAEAATEAARCNAEEKIFCVWLKIYELRNLVAAKRILVQRRRHKSRLVEILNPELQILSQWEPHAKLHLDSVATLASLLGAASNSLPVVDGAQVNLVLVNKYIGIAVDIIQDIAATIGMFYSTVSDLDFMLAELVKATGFEVQALDEIMVMSEQMTKFEMHEISLRAHLAQRVKDEYIHIPCSHQWSSNGIYGARSMSYVSLWS